MEIIKMMAMKSMVADWLNRMTSPGKPLHKPQRPHDKWLYLHWPQYSIKPFGFMDPTNRSFHKNRNPTPFNPKNIYKIGRLISCPPPPRRAECPQIGCWGNRPNITFSVHFPRQLLQPSKISSYKWKPRSCKVLKHMTSHIFFIFRGWCVCAKLMTTTAMTT